MSVTKAMQAGEYSVGSQLREWFILPGVRDQCFPHFKAVMNEDEVFSFYIEENERWFLVDDPARLEFLRKLFKSFLEQAQ